MNVSLRELSSSILLMGLGILLYSDAIAQEFIPDTYFETFVGAELSIGGSDFSDQLLDGNVILDHGSTQQEVHLYVTQEGYEKIRSAGIPYTFHAREPISLTLRSAEEIISLRSLAPCLPIMDFYPDYDAYVAMMNEWEVNYPDIYSLIELGELDSGRKILVARLGDNQEVDEYEPNVLLTSTAHGDELAGFGFSLQMIDYLLCNYDSDPEVTDLMDGVNIFINPLANPDGTYRDDNATIENPVRLNDNSIDLNRNFPDPEDGDQPDNRPRQDETQFFMDFASEYEIDLACSMHGGKEVASYPWGAFERDPADVSWWLQTCRHYVDTAQHYSPESYFTDFNDGVTNGFDWFEVRGGRQDYMIYFHRAREFELEMSDDKVLAAEELPVIWEANYRSMLAYVRQATYGLQGVVLDCESKRPLEAEIFIDSHDVDSSSVFSDARLGQYYRYLDDGTYEVSVIAEGYESVTETVEILDYEATIWNVELCSTDTTGVNEIVGLNSLKVSREGESLIIGGVDFLDKLQYHLYDVAGKEIPCRYSAGRIEFAQPLIDGMYLLHITHKKESTTYPFLYSQ